MQTLEVQLSGYCKRGGGQVASENVFPFLPETDLEALANVVQYYWASLVSPTVPLSLLEVALSIITCPLAELVLR